jgi:hypothetical protein
MKLTTTAFAENTPIPPKFAFCRLNAEKEVEMSDNINPEFKWFDIPENTKSLVFICHDSEVPTSGEDVNQEGKVVPHDLARTDFYHWLLIDLPADSMGVKEGEFSNGITPKGKQDKTSSQNTRQGINDYTNWFAGDAEMGGDYYGYDGCCPPWNDERMHIYHFTLYALDIEKLDLPERFDGREAMNALEGHILDKERKKGTYTLNKYLVEPTESNNP